MWALGIFGLGYAASAVYATEFAFGAFPIMFTMICGAHQDQRHRSSGKLSEERDKLTSNVPFQDFFEGRQSWTDLKKELKPENLLIAATFASLLAMRRAR